MSYAKDSNEAGDLDKKIIGIGDQASETQMDETRRLWEEAFDQPYERPGALFNPVNSPGRIFLNWEPSDVDVNKVYKTLRPRSLMEVSRVSQIVGFPHKTFNLALFLDCFCKSTSMSLTACYLYCHRW